MLSPFSISVVSGLVYFQVLCLVHSMTMKNHKGFTAIVHNKFNNFDVMFKIRLSNCLTGSPYKVWGVLHP